MTDLRPVDFDDQDDGLLRDAFRSVRERYDGANEEADATLRRALVHTRLQDRRRRFTRWVVLPIAAVLAASTAWAAGTGRLNPALSSVVESFHAERDSSKTSQGRGRGVAKPAETTPAPSESVAALPVPPPEPAPLETTTPFVPPPPATTAAPFAVAPSHAAPAWRPTASANTNATASANTGSIASNSAPTADTAQPPAALSSDPNGQLFAEAHRIHFAERDPARALAAWDKYLEAAPAGRFTPEARYNRAIALIRLGRRDEAKKELAAFANGSYGTYRREEARALLEAFDRDH